MPKGYPPSVFVSSTCYDLGQVRANLHAFLNSLGVDPLLSDQPEFPVTPHVTTVGNCVNVVRDRADIFVLVVGAKYGTQTDSGKSITNLEYLEAKAKGIPIYVFVLKPILHGLRYWKRNRTGDYTDIVDSPKLFEFVESLHDSQEHWVFGFDNAEDIISHLRTQLARLFMDSLLIREKWRTSKISISLQELTGESLRILFDRSTGWELDLLATVLDDEFRKRDSLKRDLRYGLQLGGIHEIGGPVEVLAWINLKVEHIVRMVTSAETILTKAGNEAIGNSGTPADAELIVYVARRLAEIYQRILEWAIEFKLVIVPEEFYRLLECLAPVASEAISKLESIAPKVKSELQRGLEAIARSEQTTLDLMFRFEGPDLTQFAEEMARLEQLYCGG